MDKFSNNTIQLMDEFSSKMIQFMTLKLKFRQKIWMSFPGFTNKDYQANQRSLGGSNQSATVNDPNHE